MAVEVLDAAEAARSMLDPRPHAKQAWHLTTLKALLKDKKAPEFDQGIYDRIMVWKAKPRKSGDLKKKADRNARAVETLRIVHEAVNAGKEPGKTPMELYGLSRKLNNKSSKDKFNAEHEASFRKLVADRASIGRAWSGDGSEVAKKEARERAEAKRLDEEGGGEYSFIAAKVESTTYTAHFNAMQPELEKSNPKNSNYCALTTQDTSGPAVD